MYDIYVQFLLICVRFLYYLRLNEVLIFNEVDISILKIIIFNKYQYVV